MRKQHKKFFTGLPVGFVEEHQHRIKHVEFFLNSRELEAKAADSKYMIDYSNGTPYVFVEPLDLNGDPVPITRMIIVKVKVENPPRGVPGTVDQEVKQTLKRRIANPHGASDDFEGGYLGYEKLTVAQYKKKYMGIEEETPKPKAKRKRKKATKKKVASGTAGE